MILVECMSVRAFAWFVHVQVCSFNNFELRFYDGCWLIQNCVCAKFAVFYHTCSFSIFFILSYDLHHLILICSWFASLVIFTMPAQSLCAILFLTHPVYELRDHCSLVADGKLVDNVQVADHHTEFAEGDLTVEISVSLHNRPVHELLQLHIVKVASDHHLEHLKELAVWDETIVVDVIDLESKSELVLLTGTSTERVETLDEFQEGDVTVVVAVEHGDDTLH